MRGVMVAEKRKVTPAQLHRRRYWYRASNLKKLEHILTCDVCFDWRVANKVENPRQPFIG